jgi:hypothetical protein
MRGPYSRSICMLVMQAEGRKFDPTQGRKVFKLFLYYDYTVTRLLLLILYNTVRASTFHEPYFLAYRTVSNCTFGKRIIFDETSFFLAYRYSTLKARFAKKSMRVL